MSPAPLKVTVLGSGTSMGVPTLGCPCRVCKSNDPHDKRLRPSVLISRGGQNVVIDTTPDFRQQALRVGLERLDAILMTFAPSISVNARRCLSTATKKRFASSGASSPMYSMTNRRSAPCLVLR